MRRTEIVLRQAFGLCAVIGCAIVLAMLGVAVGLGLVIAAWKAAGQL